MSRYWWGEDQPIRHEAYPKPGCFPSYRLLLATVIVCGAITGTLVAAVAGLLYAFSRWVMGWP